MRRAQFPPTDTAALAATLATALGLAATLLAGCVGAGAACDQDYDCGGGEVCANTRECVGADTVHRIAIRWTVQGNPASLATCAGIESLTLTIIDDGSGQTSQYAPVPCDPGIFTFARLPVGFDRVTLTVDTAIGFAGPYVAAIVAGQDVWFDLAAGRAPVDGGVSVDAAVPVDAGAAFDGGTP